MSEAIAPARFAKRIFYIEAIQVTSENMEQIAEWCKGKILRTRAKPEENYPASPFIKVDVKNPRNPRQTRAFVNDWVIRDEDGRWRVYPNKAFKLAFDEVK